MDAQSFTQQVKSGKLVKLTTSEKLTYADKLGKAVFVVGGEPMTIGYLQEKGLASLRDGKWIIDIAACEEVYLPFHIRFTGGAVKREALPVCDGKTSYDKRTAQAKVKEIEKAGRGTMRIYQCDRCPGWHLTHKGTR